ncbi:M23 family metallopeptidase [Brevundimonas sp. 2R-24]|uniref:M23 family metallopeptidase n=1 Tax=Peiella sedimenti TaxID=3061083 RepID=A0ABT8SLH0_9CAUL|nr:M23 family metallopeptidase [Caulobacteraceae bacterium XZ-24]
MIGRRTLLAAGALLPLARLAQAQTRAPTPEDILPLRGRLVQGGHAIGRAEPGAVIRLDGQEVGRASEGGWFIVGFDRDAPLEARISAGPRERLIALDRGDFPIRRIDGLPPSTVTPTDPALLERIRREAELKRAAYASRDPSDHFRDGFDWPLESIRVTSPWGAQRILNGTPARPHYGIDLAAPTGAPIRAPAAGLVVLAEPDMHFEGGLTFIDHGQGLISAYLHQSSLDVRQGDRVVRGQIIGRAGDRGRATGPHLCWRLKWRDQNLDPSLMVRA